MAIVPQSLEFVDFFALVFQAAGTTGLCYHTQLRRS